MLEDRQAFAAALRRLADHHARRLDQQTVRLYWSLLSPRLEPEGFVAACQSLEVSEFGFPTPARILAAANSRVDVVADAQSTTLYEQVLACQEYSPQGGTYYSRRRIEAQLGPVAAMLFQAAGGAHAFLSALQNADREPWVRKEFLEAARALRADPEALAAIEAHGTALAQLPGPLRERVSLIGRGSVEMATDEPAIAVPDRGGQEEPAA